MKIIDKKGRLFGIISLIDIVVIVVVILLAAGIYARFFSIEQTAVGQPSEPITYQIIIREVRPYTSDALQIGDVLYDSSGNIALGTIADKQVTDAERWSSLIDGTMAKGIVHGKYDVVLTLEADGVISDGRYYVSRTTELGAGRQADFVTKYCSFNATVLEIGEK